MRYSSSRSAQVFTYLLGKSLYVPLTSRCNSVTLPATRGPNFLLPPSVVAALCRVRDAEHASSLWAPWIAYLDMQDAPQRMPNPLERVSHILEDADLLQRPSVDELLEEIHLMLQGNGGAESSVSSVVFAGEGEPTLRLASLLAMAKSLQESHPAIPLRLVTNGLVPLVHDVNVAEQLCAAGISHVSVALMAHRPDHYEAIMTTTAGWNCANVSAENDEQLAAPCAHDRVCDFIRQALKCGLQVEATAVDRHEVDKLETEALAKRLGVHSFRWRSHFP